MVRSASKPFERETHDRGGAGALWIDGRETQKHGWTHAAYRTSQESRDRGSVLSAGVEVDDPGACRKPAVRGIGMAGRQIEPAEPRAAGVRRIGVIRQR